MRRPFPYRVRAAFAFPAACGFFRPAAARAGEAAGAGWSMKTTMKPLAGGTIWSDGIMWGLILLGLCLVLLTLLHLRQRKRRHVAEHQRRHANALKYLADRGVGEAEVAAGSRYFAQHPDADPESSVIGAQEFDRTLGPFFTATFGAALTDVIHDLLFAHSAIPSDAGRSGRLTARKPAPAGDEALRAIPYIHPGNAIRVVRAGGAGLNEVVLSTSADNLVVALPEGAHVVPGEEVEVHVDVGPALCGLVAHVTEVSRARPFAMQIGRFVEGWVIRRRQSARLKLQRSFMFSCLPFDQTGKVQSLEDVTARLTPVYEGHLRDISYGGCRLVTTVDQPFHKGDLIRFAVDLQPDMPPASLFGAIVHVTSRRQDGERTETSLHVQFLALDHASTDILTHALRQLLSAAERET